MTEKVVSMREAGTAMRGKSLFGEIATTGDGRDITRQFVGNLFPNPDTILKTRGSQRLSLWENVLEDDVCGSRFEQRRRAVVSRDWQVDAGGESPGDEEAAEFIREQLQCIQFDNVTDKMLYADWFGYAVAELVYGRDGNRVVWEKITVPDRARFVFTPTGELRMLTPQDPLDGERLPDHKFWHINAGATHDHDWYGTGMAHWCFWPLLFKRNGVKFWSVFLEKYAQPTALGKHPQGASAGDKTKLLAALRAISVDSGITIPEGMEIELLEATRQSSGDYEKMLKYMDQAITHVILGQTMTTNDGSSRSQAEVHMDVRQDLVKADADLVCESLNRGPIRWLTELNFGPGVAPPRVFRVLEEEEDVNTAAERDKTLFDIGFKPTPEYIADKYGDHYEEKTVPAPLVPGMPSAEPGEGSAFATPDPDSVEVATERLETATMAFTDQLLDQVRTMVDEAESLEDLASLLESAFPKMDVTDLGNIVALALAEGELMGRGEVDDEVSA